MAAAAIAAAVLHVDAGKGHPTLLTAIDPTWQAPVAPHEMAPWLNALDPNQPARCGLVRRAPARGHTAQMIDASSLQQAECGIDGRR